MTDRGTGFDFDVVVAGGGPAGCSAALHLVARGARVLVCEALTYPHDKLCGEFLSPECAPMLEAVGAWGVVRSLAPACIDMARLSVPAGSLWETHLPAPAWGLTRRALDAVLAHRATEAGVILREGVTVAGITGGLECGFRVELVRRDKRELVTARAVIGAHGKRALLDRVLGRRFLAQPQPFIALKRHFQGPPVSGRIELHTFPGGYCGLSTLEGAAGGPGGAANVCLLAHVSAWQRAGGGPDRAQVFVNWMRTQNPRLEAWLGRATPLGDRWLSIAQVPFGPKRAVVNEVLMAGDAAGLVTPLAGDGIAMALRGGQLAAEHLLPFLAGSRSPAALTAGYGRAWQREFGPRLRVGRLAQAVMLRPRLFGAALRVFQSAPALGQYFVTHTRDLRAFEER
jgi:flavin-dependent dehydrogenase